MGIEEIILRLILSALCFLAAWFILPKQDAHSKCVDTQRNKKF